MVVEVVGGGRVFGRKSQVLLRSSESAGYRREGGIFLVSC
jgi:hypothetical protein